MALLDAGYDRKEYHFLLRARLGYVSLMYPNVRRSKKKSTRKSIDYYKKLLYQTTLDRFIPKRVRKKRYRRCRLILKDEKEYKKYYNKRVASEQQFATLKKDLFLESHELMGLQIIQKHVAMKCLCILIIAFTALCLGVPEALRAPKYFQH